MCKYSIIIPVYNCEKYLKQCVYSIKNQSIQDYEIILVEDGSPDHCAELCDWLANGDSRIKVFHKENGGAASARNYGINNSKGKYLLFIDGDDTLEENCLESIDKILKIENSEMIVFGMAFDYYDNEMLMRTEYLSCKHNSTVSIAQLKKEYQSYFADNALSSACNKVFKMDVIQKYKLQFQEGMTLYEDYDFVICYLQYINQITCIDKVFYHYRLNTNNNHLNDRVHDLLKLKKNLSILLTSMKNFSLQSSEKNRILSSGVNLYMQMLIQKLLVESLSMKEIEKSVLSYCSNPVFREILNTSGVQLGFNEKKLLKKIDQNQFFKIYILFVAKRIKRNLRCIVKRMLKRK